MAREGQRKSEQDRTAGYRGVSNEAREGVLHGTSVRRHLCNHLQDQTVVHPGVQTHLNVGSSITANVVADASNPPEEAQSLC